MEQIQDLLNAPYDTFTDRNWIEENAKVLYKEINKAIRRPETIGPAVDIMLRMYPRMIGHEDIKKWVKVSEKALAKLGIAQRVPKKTPDRVEYLINSQYVIKRADHSTTVITKTKRQRHRLNPRQMFETYLILLTTLYYRGDVVIDDERIEDMLSFARTVNSPHHYHKLYQTLAFILTRQTRGKQAALYAHAAYDYFVEQKNKMEMALCASALANAHYYIDTEEAFHWLNTASELFSKMNYRGQYAYVALQTANLFIRTNQFEEAVQWAGQAVQEYSQIDNTYGVIQAKHTRAMANGYLGNFDAATVDVNEALDYFEENELDDMSIHATYTLSFIEAREGNTDGALSRLRNLLKMIAAQEPSEMMAHIEKQANGLIQTVEDGNVADLESYEW